MSHISFSLHSQGLRENDFHGLESNEILAQSDSIYQKKRAYPKIGPLAIQFGVY